MLLAGLVGCAQPPPPTNLGQAYAEARATLDRCLSDSDAFTRSHAIEALADTIGLHAGQAYEKALGDPSPAVRFAAAMAIGDTRYVPAKGQLLNRAGDKTVEPDRRVMPAVVYALYRLGDNTYAAELYNLLFDPEKEVRANAALAMGRMEEASAIGPLKTRLNDEQDPLVRLQIIESLATLGDTVSALSLEAYTKKTPYIDERLVAIPAMARVRSTSAPGVLNELLESRQPPRVRVAAAGALGMLGQSSPTGYALCRAAAVNPQKVLDAAYGGRKAGSEQEAPSLQRLAILSMGWMGNERAVDDLYGLLSSHDGGVRVAAAMSILRLLPGYQQPLPPSALAPPAPSVQPAPVASQPEQPAPVASAPEQPPVRLEVPPSPPPETAPAPEPAGPATAPAPKAPSDKWRLRTAGGKD